MDRLKRRMQSECEERVKMNKSEQQRKYTDNKNRD